MNAVPSIDAASAIYEVASQGEVTWELVDHDAFREYSQGVSGIDTSLAHMRDEPFWVETVRLLRRARSLASAAPLPFGHPSLDLRGIAAELAPHMARAAVQFPGQPSKDLASVVHLLNDLAASTDNPLGDKAYEILSRLAQGTVGLLLPTARLLSEVERLMQGRSLGVPMRVLTPSELADTDPLDALVVVGSTAWYRRNAFVFFAPRARHVVMLKWSWVRDALPEPDVLVASRRGEYRAPAPSRPPRALGEEIGSDDLAPAVDWNAVAKRVGTHGDARPGEATAARVFLLAGGWAVATSASEGGTIHVVEPDLEGDARIQEIPVGEVEEGDFVLLRSQGGGDLVVELADRELGHNALRLRRRQQEWKARLRTMVRKSSYTSVIRELQRLGSPRASYLNLHNWLSPRSLRTRDPRDFAAIIELIGLGAEWQEYWRDMGLLLAAHRTAGHRIRKLLTDVVANADLSQLEGAGVLSFELEDQAGGSLTAYRVEAASPNPVEVNEHRLGRPVPAEDLWLV